MGFALYLCARGGTSGSASYVESPPAASIAGRSSTGPSLNGCNQSGKESPPAVDRVDLSGHCDHWDNFSDLHSSVIPSLVRNGCFPVFQMYK